MNAKNLSSAAATPSEDVVRVSPVAPCGRLSLRARGDLAPLGTALGLSLPTRIGERARAETLEALCLGPDEWVLHCPDAAVEGIVAACAEVYAQHPHSLVDISGREVTYVIDGPRAADLLTLGCPRDIDTIRPGDGRRTVFDGVTVVLWRDGDDSFRLDCWNSFGPHVLTLLEIGCRELAAEAA